MINLPEDFLNYLFFSFQALYHACWTPGAFNKLTQINTYNTETIFIKFLDNSLICSVCNYFIIPQADNISGYEAVAGDFNLSVTFEETIGENSLAVEYRIRP